MDHNRKQACCSTTLSPLRRVAHDGRIQCKFGQVILLVTAGPACWCSASGYVEQSDTLLPELTVREMLLYTAELKCPRSEPLPDKRARVEQLLDTLRLRECAGTLIGDSLARGVSGGQVRS